MQPNAVAGVERLSWAEVCSRYPDQWVVVVDMEDSEETFHPFDTGVVVSHHAHRREASPSVKLAFQTHEEVGTFWTGRMVFEPAMRIAIR